MNFPTHARRKFTEALDENRALATQALYHIGKLYKVESEADEAGLSIEERKEKRIRESYPVNISGDAVTQAPLITFFRLVLFVVNNRNHTLVYLYIFTREYLLAFP